MLSNQPGFHQYCYESLNKVVFYRGTNAYELDKNIYKRPEQGLGKVERFTDGHGLALLIHQLHADGSYGGCVWVEPEEIWYEASEPSK